MTFAQLHDGFYRNPKVQAAGSVAAWMWAASIGYASEGLTDGFIPLAALASLCPDLDTKPRLKVAARLVEVGLWEVADGGFGAHRGDLAEGELCGGPQEPLLDGFVLDDRVSLEH